MTTTRGVYLGMAAAGIAVLLAASAVRLSGLALSEAEGQQKPSAAVSIDKDDIGGVVTRSEEHTSEPQSQSNLLFLLFFFNDTAPTEISPLSLHDALPILALSEAEGQQKPSAAVSIDKDDIGGVVT